MSRSAKRPAWLSDEQQRVWQAYMRVQLQLSYEMNRQLQSDNELSLSDYHVLHALSDSPDGCLRITALATRIGWERSRVSHQSRRMQKRGLVDLALASDDRRVTVVSLTASGWETVRAAAGAHVALVRRMFFDGLAPDLLEPLTVALEQIHGHMTELDAIRPR
ncbi:MarR family winged helix-turn-helix transcriptional regulator [Kribbella sp. NPDC059898]|uniref:MarR family winged helix-turn-helix transcriptional regulator n=1 Tax=Kribbella sp. NPDC059898 TaxID=3346995 RepID=UPI00364D1089